MKSPNARSVVMSNVLWQQVCQVAADKGLSAGAFVRMVLIEALRQHPPK